MSILETRNVTYDYVTKYQTVHALRGITAAFESGDFYAVIGKSGCGKSTLLHLLAGLDVPTGGKILFNGSDLSKMDRDALRLRHISVIYQGYNLFPLLTVLENACYPMLLQGISGDRAKELATERLEALSIPASMHRKYPAMLSGGEQQRVAIARALALHAEVILADEPTGQLDSENGQVIVNILKDLAHKENKCVIMVTHDLALAEVADRIYRMKDGMIEERIDNKAFVS